jgi:ATP-dependent phosphofructokinase / diphosphate-dependent phosphofructokinase
LGQADQSVSSSPVPSPKRACILTGGGDAPGLNAVLRGFVHRATQLGIEVFGSEDGFEGLIDPTPRLRRMQIPDVRGIYAVGGSILGCSNRANPFHYPGRKIAGPREDKDVSALVVERLRQHEIDVLVLAGGDGTMTHASMFTKMGLNCVGIPKTIDNDLAATDYTFGFDTAIRNATIAIDTLQSTAAAHDRVMIVEVMGRYAGWIALHSGIAGGADVILIPEIPYDVRRVVAKIKQRESLGITFTVIVVSEGARPVDGELAIAEAGSPGHLPKLGGAGERLMKQLASGDLNHEIRVTVLGHLQRGGSPTPFDRVLGTRTGTHAADLCHRRAYGQMVCLRGTELASVPIGQAIGNPKLVDPNGQLVAAARAIGTELGA